MRDVRVAAAIAVLAVAGAVAGCSSGDGDGTPAPSGSASSTTSLPTAVANTPALRSAVRLTTCVAADGGWKASGTVGNDRDAAFRYRVSVYFTSSAATVLGYADTVVEVAAKKSTSWTATAKFAAPTNTKCVLVGVAKA